MSVDIAAILKAIEQILELEKKIETAISAEADVKRRNKMLDALEERDLETIRKILFSV